MRIRLTILLAFLVLLIAPNESLRAQSVNAPFYLHHNDTVVFYGDSITAQRYYTYWVEVYTETRFPKLNVQFYNAGIGGDRVTGGGAGPIDLRLSRDVFPFKPTVVTIMLGMNDGSYQPLTPEIESTYTQGYEHILQSLQTTLPTARIAVLGPSPYDEVTRPEMFPGGYNSTLVKFSAIDSQLAQKHKSEYIDLNAPFVAAFQRGQALNPTATEMLLPDRVHPENLTHWLMTAAILKGWNAPSLVSSVTIDAASQKVLDQQSAHVSALTATGASAAWTELDDALPLPIDNSNATYHFLNQLTDLVLEFNQQPLVVRGLSPGTYRLTIDDQGIDKFTDAQLSQGINLANYPTPMRNQASPVSWLTRDRDNTLLVREDMLVNARNNNTSAEPGATDLLNFAAIQQKHIQEAAQPKPHNFKLTPVTN